ncbi:zinc finger CCHC domain-containing protein 7 [Amphiprion ocellaris]|uniref:zinc finger CCHC domain-containing protein 7 n=1 Tax=Amphiprion ocellaris TaxID=80972 RepID=UPI00241141FB|nr:zinc finger CCHC domain-containing protein 7 [Amphiprion ocellaris]XP_023124953.2 zinc finger CCHC domain-containing protein 7 [Amphiprion ocellaris]
MYCTYQDREELEDDLYQEDEGDSDGSEANSELEFRLYSQLHYSSNPGELEEQEDGEEREPDREHQDSQKQRNDAEELKPGREIKPPSPIYSKLQQHLKKKKGENQDKQQKRKIDFKGQKSKSSCLEEVIVIDSGPDVISISDDTAEDDDEGVCALKGHGLHQPQTSTPAHQETQKRGLGATVTVDSSSSESDSEDVESKSESDSSSSSDSSDSDALENWMILGRGKQDGDQSISLNLEGGSDSNEDGDEKQGNWLVSDKDIEARIYNKDKGARIAVQRVASRYYTGKNVHCRNCNKTGHLSKNCPEPKKVLPCFLCGTSGHVVSECPRKHCNNCGLPGHLYESCSERAYWHKQCHRCSMTGHFFDACPEIWRQYHITTKTGPPVKRQAEDSGRSPAFCYNCSKKGHFGHECTQRRMFNGTYPSIPFINHYDTGEDINRRQHRIKLRVKELKKNGYIPGLSETILTPGPPKKKLKINHHKNSHLPNHKPHQTPNNHKPNPSHIFFKDNSDFSAARPKTNKYKQESIGSAKPWKPKRPVPTSRDPLPPSKLVFDEADDFPRGGGTGESMQKKKKKRRMNKMKQVPFGLPGGHRDSRPDYLCRTVKGATPGPQSKQQKAKKNPKRRDRNLRKADKQFGAEMYPTDENLFSIKQRKRRR